MSKFLVGFSCLFLSIIASANSGGMILPTLPYSMLAAELPQTMAVVFNDESEKLYGDVMDNNLHVDKICQVIEAMADTPPRSVFIDWDVYADPAAAECIKIVATELEIPITLTQNIDKPTVFSDSNYVAYGYPQVLTRVENRSELPSPQKGNHNWLDANARVGLVAPAVIPFSIPAYFLTLTQGVDEKDLLKLSFYWSRRVAVSEITEQNVPKTSFQEVISGASKSYAGKYVFIGVDQDKYDAFTTVKGEVVNGVFAHQHFAAAYLSLKAATFPPEVAPMVIFGEYTYRP